jgi:general secretion pathway protein I
MKTNLQQGFTLIEVLIALAIVAIALIAIVQTSILTIENANYLKQKTIAIWVADNAIANLQLGLIQAPVTNAPMTMLNRQWYWSALEDQTRDKYVDKLSVTVRESPQKQPIVTLQSFKPVVPQ